MKLGKIIGGIVIGVAAVAAAPFTGGGSLLAGAAAFGLGTATAAACAAGAGIFGGIVGSLWDDDDETNNNYGAKRKLGILGMKSSGKTTLLDKMRGVIKKTSQTFSEDYEEFTYTTQSGKIVNIAKGKDIGGTKSYVLEYRTIIAQNDVLFYFFNVHEYVENLEYRRDCNSRLSLIFPNLTGKKIVLIATHADRAKLDKSQLKDSVMELTIDKNYSKLFNENFFVVDLTNNEQFTELIENLF